MNGALDAVFACPGHHLFGFITCFHRTQAHFAQQCHACSGQLLEVVLGHAFFDDGRTGNHFDTARAKVAERTLRGDGQGFQTHDVFGATGQMHLTGRDHGGHAAVHGGVNPANLVLPWRPVAKHRMHMAVDQARRHASLLHIDGGLGAFGVHILEAPHSGDKPIHHHDGVGLQNGLVDVAREQQTDVLDDNFA